MLFVYRVMFYDFYHDKSKLHRHLVEYGFTCFIFFQAYLKQIEVNVTLNKYCTPKTDSTKMLGLEDYFSFESWSLFR